MVNDIREMFSFNGRIGRSDYWLLNMVAWLVFLLFTGVVFLGSALESSGASIGESLIPVAFVGYFLCGWVSCATFVKRLHDRGMSGGWLALAFVPIIGFVWFFVLGFLPGAYDDNIHGPSLRPRILDADTLNWQGRSAGRSANVDVFTPGAKDRPIDPFW